MRHQHVVLILHGQRVLSWTSWCKFVWSTCSMAMLVVERPKNVGQVGYSCRQAAKGHCYLDWEKWERAKAPLVMSCYCSQRTGKWSVGSEFRPYKSIRVPLVSHDCFPCRDALASVRAVLMSIVLDTVWLVLMKTLAVEPLENLSGTGYG